MSPILAKFRAALDAIYGERIERSSLYGSQARRGASGFGLRRGGFPERHERRF
jgi:hypothetical protein